MPSGSSDIWCDKMQIDDKDAQQHELSPQNVTKRLVKAGFANFMAKDMAGEQRAKDSPIASPTFATAICYESPRWTGWPGP